MEGESELEKKQAMRKEEKKRWKKIEAGRERGDERWETERKI